MDAIRERVPRPEYDAVVVGSGPNGFAAGITLARAGCSVLLVEAAPTLGGGLRSAELTLPGFVHDVCSAVHPLGIASPFFESVDLAAHDLEWIFPTIQFAHPLDHEPAVLVRRSVGATAEELGADQAAYRRLMDPLVRDSDRLIAGILGPLRLPRHPVALAAFGRHALRSAIGLAQHRFTAAPAQAIVAGAAAHSQLPLSYPTTAGTGLLLALLAHAGGWPVARHGSQAIAAALQAHFEALGGHCLVDAPVVRLQDLPPSRLLLLDLSTAQLLHLAGSRLPGYYRGQLSRFQPGPGVFKLDYALDGPVPWHDPRVGEAGTVHIGGSLTEIARAEAEVAAGRHPERPFVLLCQQSALDPSRAPAGKHTCWAYCHVPNGSTVDMTAAIEGQIERFAPRFRDLILARHTSSPKDLEQYNANYGGGDITGGAMIVRQLYTRPVVRLDPYATPARGIYLCSSSTPPGAGVHGMCGYWAARSALRQWAG